MKLPKRIALATVITAIIPFWAASAPFNLDIVPSRHNTSPDAVTISSVVFQTDASAVGAYDFELVFDTHVLTLQSLQSLTAELQDHFFVNLASFTQGRARIAAFNATSTQVPQGLVTILRAALQTKTTEPFFTSVNIEVHKVLDTGAVALSPVQVSPQTILFDNLFPQTAILFPQPNVILSRPLTVQASASDNQGLNPVIFLVDGSTVSQLAQGPFNFFFDIRDFADGPHTLTVRAVDLAGNSKEASVPVLVSYAPPPAPAIAQPQNGFFTASGVISVSGTAEPNIAVTLFVNGIPVADAVASSSGTYSFPNVSFFTEGTQSLTVQASDAKGSSPQSQTVTGVFDFSIPQPPIFVNALSQKAGAVQLSWQAPSGETPVSYKVFRSTTEADLTEGAAAPVARLIAQNIAQTGFKDTPPLDGLFFYGIVSVDAAGNDSLLSEITAAVSDRVSPSASIEFTSQQPALGQGLHPIETTVSEMLSEPPILTFTPQGQSPVSVNLEPATITLWQGSVAITSLTASGLASFAFQGKDLTQNVGNQITQGQTFAIDSQGPVGTLALNGPLVKAGPVSVNLDLDEPAAFPPSLSFKPSGQSAIPITLSSPTLETRFEGSFTVDALTGDGPAQFSYSAQDVLGNVSAILAGTTSFFIDTQAPGVPRFLRANSAKAGVVNLSWSAPLGETPFRYLIYRGGVKISTEISPATDGTGSYSDIPSEGSHLYQVSSLDLAGNESAHSEEVTGVSDATPPSAPANLTAQINAFGQIEISWEAGSGEASASFLVYRATEPIATVAGLSGRPAAPPFVETPEEDALYYYRASALDSPGNESGLSNEASVLYDNAAPVITFTGVSEGQHLSRDAFPAFTVTDLNLDTASVQATLNLEPFVSGQRVFAESNYTLSVQAADTQGHQASKDLHFTIDKTSPTLAISSITQNQLFSSPAQAFINAADLNLATVTATLANLTKGTSAPYVSGRLIFQDGSYTLTAQAQDLAGNLTVRQVSFTVDAPPVPLANLTAVLEDNSAALSWTSNEPDLVGFRVFKNGIRISASIQAETSFKDLSYLPNAAHVYEVAAIDSKGREGEKARVTAQAVEVNLERFGVSIAGQEALTRRFFDEIRLALTNKSSNAITTGPSALEVLSNGTVFIQQSAPSVSFAPAQSQTISSVLSVPSNLPNSVKLTASIALPSEPGTTVSRLKSFTLPVRDPAEPVIEIFSQALVRNTESSVQIKFNNRGSAPLDIRTAKIVNFQSQAVPDVRLKLLSPEGLLLSSRDLNQTGNGVLSALLGSEQIYFARVPAGSSFLFDSIPIPVPDSAGTAAILEASISTPSFSLQGENLKAPGGFLASAQRPVTAAPPYTVTVSPDRSVYDQGQAVLLTGQARDSSQNLLPGATVQVLISGGGFERFVSTLTKTSGQYQAQFNPLPNEAGFYTLSAFHPDFISREPQSGFSITGFEFSEPRIAVRLSQGATIAFTADLVNTGQTSLEGLAAQITGPSVSGLSVSVEPASVPSVLAAGAKAKISIQAQAQISTALGKRNYELVTSESHGFERRLPVEVEIFAGGPIPAATPQLIEVGIVAGEKKEKVITLENLGFTPWQNVTLTEPTLSFVRLLSLSNLGNIEPGQSASFTLSFEPGAGLPTGAFAQNPLIEVQSANAPTVPINALAAVTTSKKGSLAFSVIEADKPRDISGQGVPVPQARLTAVSLDISGLQFIQTADANGVTQFTDIPAGRYAFRAEEEGYLPQSGTLDVEPGLTKTQEILLSQSLVTYEWSVTPTLIEDRYDITLNATFKTDVPAPTLVVDPPAITVNQNAGQSTFAQYTITNKGLVSAFDVELKSSADGALKVELPFDKIPEIKAQQTIVIPLKITQISASCHAANIQHPYKYPCAAGTVQTASAQGVAINAGNTCGGGGASGSSTGICIGCSSISGISGGAAASLAPISPPLTCSTGFKCSEPGKCDCQVGPASIGALSGIFTHNESDLSFPVSAGISPQLVRFYSSSRFSAGAFGMGWLHKYEQAMSLSITGSLAVLNVDFTREDGSLFQYKFRSEATVVIGEGSTQAFEISVGAVAESLSGLPNTLRVAAVSGKQATALELISPDGTKSRFESVGDPNVFKPVSITDRNGNTLTLTYAGGLLTKVEDNRGRFINLTYDGSNRIVSAADSGGRSVSYGYNGSNELVSFTDVATAQTQYAYESQRLATITYPDGSHLITTYNAQGKAVALTRDDDNEKVSNLYDSQNKVNTATDALNRQTKYRYTELYASPLPIEIEDALGSKTSMEYDSQLNLSLRRDPLGRATTFKYDSKNNLVETIDAKNQATRMAYEPNFNQVASITDSKGNQAQMSYDGQGNLVQTTDAKGNATQMSYGPDGLLSSVRDAKNGVTSFSYNSSGYLTQISDPLQRTTVMVPDILGRVTQTTDAKNKTTQFNYDTLGNLTSVTDAANGLTQYTYQRGGLGPVGSCSNCANMGSVLRTLTDARNKTTAFNYDLLGRLTSVTNPLNQTKSFVYDKMGNLKTVTDAKGQILSFDYDALNRLTKKNLPEGVVNYAYDPLGNLTSVSDPDSSISMSYDEVSRLTGAVQTLPGGFTGTLRYAYDANGNRTSMESPWGNFSYRYDSLNRLISITNPQGQIVSFEYDELSRRVKMNYPNGTETIYSYDFANQLKQLIHKKGTSVLAFFEYGYDAAGNRTSMTTQEGAHNYDYDDLHRLTSAQHPANSALTVKNETFSYDAVGNRLQDAAITGYQYDDANRLTENSSFTYAYDANGNMTSRSVIPVQAGIQTRYFYDSEDQLIRVEMPDGLVVEHKYDALGKRIEKIVTPYGQPSRTMRYIYDNDHILATLDGSNNILMVFTSGPGLDEPFIMNSAGSNYFYHADLLGSIVALSDSQGEIVERVEYAVYGKSIFKDSTGIISEQSTIGSPYAFTGREFDAESSLLYFGERFLDPLLGRFISPDPIEFEGGDVNFYVYVLNQPTNLIDIAGLFPFFPRLLPPGIIRPPVPKNPPKPPKNTPPTPSQPPTNINVPAPPSSGVCKATSRDNEYVEKAKEEAQRTGRNVCDILREWQDEAKRAGKTEELIKIIRAQKALKCRNQRKRGQP